MKLIDAISVLGSLAQPARLKVFRLLVKQGEEGLCAGDISKKLGVPKPTLSFHLKDLVNAGLIGSEKDGRSITYRLQPKRMNQLMNFLMEDCCQGKPELCLTEPCEESGCSAN
jgi:DNA-binding transcriptional ArsR family regulator